MSNGNLENKIFFAWRLTREIPENKDWNPRTTCFIMGYSFGAVIFLWPWRPLETKSSLHINDSFKWTLVASVINNFLRTDLFRLSSL
jgi:hypothetical protein